MPAYPDLSQTALDQLLRPEGNGRWNAFYDDRSRPCPFFGAGPDENLVEWVTGGLVPHGRTLDLGCGHGRNSIFLARQGFEVEGVDFSESGLAWAAEAAQRAGVSIGLVCASVFEAELKPAACDFIYDSGLFHHIAPHRRQQYVGLVARCLKPGGKFGLTCFTPDGGSGYSDAEVYERGSLGGGLGYTEQQLREHWSGAGLQVEIVRTMKEVEPGAPVFGKGFLWALLASRR
ncbi:MAG: class I SAM-dependent methyltransferase [Burkholderiales bacterium]|nr:class I SAM-dependent methyltransferase [Burkholderiales bacterium]